MEPIPTLLLMNTFWVSSTLSADETHKSAWHFYRLLPIDIFFFPTMENVERFHVLFVQFKSVIHLSQPDNEELCLHFLGK